MKLNMQRCFPRSNIMRNAFVLLMVLGVPYCYTVELTYEYCMDKALSIWTELDLIRATEASELQKNIKSECLFNLISSLGCALKSIDTSIVSSEQRAEISHVVNEIRRSFDELFDDIGCLEIVQRGSRMLRHMDLSLKEPS